MPGAIFCPVRQTSYGPQALPCSPQPRGRGPKSSRASPARSPLCAFGWRTRRLYIVVLIGQRILQEIHPSEDDVSQTVRRPTLPPKNTAVPILRARTRLRELIPEPVRDIPFSGFDPLSALEFLDRPFHSNSAAGDQAKSAMVQQDLVGTRRAGEVAQIQLLPGGNGCNLFWIVGG